MFIYDGDTRLSIYVHVVALVGNVECTIDFQYWNKYMYIAVATKSLCRLVQDIASDLTYMLGYSTS